MLVRDGARERLWAAIQGKIEKHYSRAAKGTKSWLLAYEYAGPCLGPVPSEATLLAREKLAKLPRVPFDEVWSCVPYPGVELGEVERVWPP
jgi:hypothetical protein